MLASDKIVKSLSHRDQVLWPVYVTVGNLDRKTRRTQNCPATLLLGSIPIIHDQMEDSNNKNRDLKVKINHIALKTIFERIEAIH